MLDLETTGANPVHDRITEIALVRVEAGHEVARWSTLLNPGTPISPFIQKLTGIRDDMVAEAPEFDAVATQLMALLKDAVLVAHNVRFDHSFLLNEFARLGSAFRIKTMCTVRLSRLLYPQYKSHGLDASRAEKSRTPARCLTFILFPPTCFRINHSGGKPTPKSPVQR